MSYVVISLSNVVMHAIYSVIESDSESDNMSHLMEFYEQNIQFGLLFGHSG